MGSLVFYTCAFATTLVVFLTLKRRGDTVGWWLGVTHGVLCLLALAGWTETTDADFAVSMALLAIYAGAMCINEVVAQLRATGTGA